MKIPLDKLADTPCEGIGYPGAQHAGKNIREIECPDCGVHFTDCERCFDSDLRCMPCLRKAMSENPPSWAKREQGDA